MSEDDAARAFPDDTTAKDRLTTHAIHAKYLLSAAGVNALTSKYLEMFRAGLAAEDERLTECTELNIYEWLHQHMLNASTNALCGTKLLEANPDFGTEFWPFEHGLLDMLFGTPRLFARQAYNSRDRLLENMKNWLNEGYGHGEPKDDLDWEPHFGAKVMRKRHDFYKQQGMSLKAQAGHDLLFLSG